MKVRDAIKAVGAAPGVSGCLRDAYMCSVMEKVVKHPAFHEISNAFFEKLVKRGAFMTPVSPLC